MWAYELSSQIDRIVEYGRQVWLHCAMTFA
jgi:hypothetical protein